MDWIRKTSSSFKYCGKKVKRRRVFFKTIFGDFEVFESVGGNCFYRHPFIKSNYIGLGGFDNGLEDWFGKSKSSCKSMKEGIEICEKVMATVKILANSY